VNPQRLIGIVLIVLGIVLLIIGINSSNSFSDQVNEMFTGRFTDTTMWYIIGGAVSIVLGIGLAAISWKR